MVNNESWKPAPSNTMPADRKKSRRGLRPLESTTPGKILSELHGHVGENF